MPRVNILLVGPERITRNAVRLILQDRQETMLSWQPGEPFLFPAVAPGGTVVLHEVGSLSADDQVRLLAWLDEAVGRTHFISTTSTPLLPQVADGTFLEALFYRLNTVFLRVSE